MGVFCFLTISPTIDIINVKMSQAIDGFMLDKSLNLSHATVAKYRYVLLRFASFVDDRLIGDVGTVDVRRWLLSLSDAGLSRRTGPRLLGRAVIVLDLGRGRIERRATSSGDTSRRQATQSG